MSHFTVLVITDGDYGDALAPFDEDLEDVENPKWDWYALGGRWMGSLVLKAPSPTASLGEPGVFDNTAPNDGLHVDAAQAGDIDWEATAKEFWGSTQKALTWAMITLEGRWLQKGEMGWWGMSDPEKASEDYDHVWWGVVRNLAPEQMVYLVDCHI